MEGMESVESWITLTGINPFSTKGPLEEETLKIDGLHQERYRKLNNPPCHIAMGILQR